MLDDDTFQFIIDEKEAGVRIDKILVERYAPTYSRSYFQDLIENEFVLINDFPVKKRICPKPGDVVQVFFSLSKEITLEPQCIPLNIIYEDEDLIAVNKPSDLVVHPAPGHPKNTLVNALLYHCQELKPENKEDLRPGIVHRLDRGTSGVILCVKSIQAQRKMIELFSERKIKKTYLAVCVGNPGKQKIKTKIGRHPVYRQKMAVLEEGKEAITEIFPLASDGKRTLLKINLMTGRTHQIRVHLRYLQTPVVGDPLYGYPSINQDWKVERPLLHAFSLEFQHPFKEKMLHLEATLPSDMNQLIKKWFPNFEISKVEEGK